MKYLIISFSILFLGFFGFFNPIRNYYVKLISPIQFGLSNSAKEINDTFLFYKNLRAIRSENILLKTKINELEAQVAENKVLKSDIESLKLQLKIKNEFTFEHELLIAEIMGNSTDLTGSTAVISLGSSHGVTKGANVISGRQIVGIVKEVMSEKSLVDLINSPNVSLTVYDIDSPNKPEGLATGDYGTSIKLSRILPFEVIKQGDFIYSSGKDGFILPNLLVGIIEDVREDPSQPLKTATLKTSVDFAKLNKVFVVRVN